MPKIKCDFCERTTSQGYGERSGFGHIKGQIKDGTKYDITSCPDHSDLAFAKLWVILKGVKA